MNNINDKLKKYFSSNFGKLAAFITCVSFVSTLALSILLRNRIDVSVLKGLLSAAITMIILYAVSLALKKYLGEIMENSNLTGDDAVSSAYNAPSENDENDSQTNSVNQADMPNKFSDNESKELDAVNLSDSIFGEKAKTVNNNIDKNNKVGYHNNLRGDIGDIILSGKTPDISDSMSYYGGGNKVNERIVEKEVMEDPQKTASAIRTMIAKDDKKKKKEDD